MTLRLASTIELDDPVDLPAGWVFDRKDRRYIDSQILAIETHILRGTLRGVIGTWMDLDPGASRDGAAGDCVCLSLSSNQAQNVTLATAASLAAAGGVFGVLTAAYAKGSKAHVALLGALPRSVTGLSVLAGDAQYVRANPTTSRCERVATLGGSDFAVGRVDAIGNLFLQRGSAATGGGGSFSEADLRAAAAVLTANIAFNAKRLTGVADPVGAQDGATKIYVDNQGALLLDPVPPVPPAGTNSTMTTIALADNTVYEIVVSVTARDGTNNIFSAYHSQKWARAGGGSATLIQANDPVQVAITGVSATASTLVGSGNNVLLKFAPTVATRYHADVFVRATALAHA